MTVEPIAERQPAMWEAAGQSVQPHSGERTRAPPQSILLWWPVGILSVHPP